MPAKPNRPRPPAPRRRPSPAATGDADAGASHSSGAAPRKRPQGEPGNNTLDADAQDAPTPQPVPKTISRSIESSSSGSNSGEMVQQTLARGVSRPGRRGAGGSSSGVQSRATLIDESSVRQSPTLDISLNDAGEARRSQIQLASVEATLLKPTLSRYALGNELGKGGMGIVRVASDPALRREVAVKLMLKPGDVAARREFMDEAQITGQLEHPNIVPVHELGTDERGRPFIAMKRIGGKTLLDVLELRRKRNRRWQEDAGTLLDIFGKVCDAIAYAHARGVIHRDLKPENIMVGEYGEVLLMDWGLAKPIGAADEVESAVSTGRRDAQPDLTMRGEVMGTPSYMCPEQARGEVEEIDTRSDIFGLGAILYSMLTLTAPYSGETLEEVLEKAAMRALVPPRQQAPKRGIPKELEAIVLKAMDENPRRRYRSAGEFKADIQNHLTSMPLKARRDPPWTRAAKWGKRHPVATMSSTMTVVFGLVVALLGLQLYASTQATKFAEAEAKRLEERAAREEAVRIAAVERAEREEAVRIAAEARAEQEIAVRLAAEDRAEREAAERALAQARAQEAEELLGTRVRQILDTQTQESIEEFYRLRREAEDKGYSDNRFMRSIAGDQANEFLRAFDALFDVLHDIGAEPTADQWFRRGLLRRFAGDYVGAAEDYTEVIRLEPRDSIAYNNRGNVLRMVGKLEEAQLDYDRAIEIDPTDTTTLNNRANNHMDLGNLEAARADYQRISEIDPNDASAYHGLANVVYREGDEEEALRLYTRTIELDPQFAQAYRNRASIWLRRRQYDKELDDLNRAIEIDPEYAVALEYRGDNRARRGEYQLAIEDYTRAIEVRPTYWRLYFDRANARRNSGDWDGAIEDYTEAIELNADFAPSFANRADVYSRLRNYEAAAEDYTEAIALVPDHRPFYYERGLMHSRLQRNDEAYADFNRVIELDPEYAWGWGSRARLRLQMNDAEGAVADLNRAIELDSNDTILFFNRGNSKRALRDFEGALADYTRAVELDSNNASAYGNRGITHLDLGDAEAAIADYERAIEIRPRFFRFWANRGIALQRLGQTEEAIESLQRAYEFADGDETNQAWIAEYLRDYGGTIPD